MRYFGRDVFSFFLCSFLFTDFEVQNSPQFCSVEVFRKTFFAEISLHNFFGQRIFHLIFLVGLSFDLFW